MRGCQARMLRSEQQLIIKKEKRSNGTIMRENYVNNK